MYDEKIQIGLFEEIYKKQVIITDTDVKLVAKQDVAGNVIFRLARRAGNGYTLIVGFHFRKQIDKGGKNVATGSTNLRRDHGNA